MGFQFRQRIGQMRGWIIDMYHTEEKIPNSQRKVISENYAAIEREMNTYIKRYIKIAKKRRVEKEPLFRKSSLVNYHQELGI